MDDVKRSFLRWLILAVAFSASCTSCSHKASPNPDTKTASPTLDITQRNSKSMNVAISPYSWIRNGASIYTARIKTVTFAPTSAGKRTTTISFTIEETLWGISNAPLRRVTFEEPASEFSRLKFPTPPWGAIPLVEGTRILLATKSTGGDITSVSYVSHLEDTDAAHIQALRDLLREEASPRDAKARKTLYLKWLGSGSPGQVLFAGEALARDKDFVESEPTDEIARAFARAFQRAQDPRIQIDLAEWMWAGVYTRTDEKGRAAILNALLEGAGNPSEDVRRICLDNLSEADMEDLESELLVKVPAALPYVEQRIEEETAHEPRARLQKIVSIIKP